jgi:hypothetical protein
VANVKEWEQPPEKIIQLQKHSIGKPRELKQQRPELFAEQVHHGQELANLRVAIHQQLFVRDDSRNLCGEDESAPFASRTRQRDSPAIPPP